MVMEYFVWRWNGFCGIVGGYGIVCLAVEWSLWNRVVME